MATTGADDLQIDNPPGLSDDTAADNTRRDSERISTHATFEDNGEERTFATHEHAPLAVEASIPELPAQNHYTNLPATNGAYTETEDISSRMTYSEAMAYQTGLGDNGQNYLDVRLGG